LAEVEEGRVVSGEAAVFEGKPFVVVGVPAFNEEKTIAKVVVEAQKYADKVVVCDDGSTDMTAEIAECLGADVVRHERNLGYGATVRSLFKCARELGADVFVTLDGDGQHFPGEIPEVVKPIMDGRADIVIGSRFLEGKGKRNSVPWFRKLGIKVLTRAANSVSKFGVRDAQSGFRAYSRRALEKLNVFEEGMGVSVEILMEAKKQDLKVCEVPATCNYKEGKPSTHDPLRHGADVLMSIVKLVVEDKPLVFLGVPGIICLIVGAFFGAWMLQIYGIERRIVTNIALASIAFILMGFFALSTAITLYAISRLARKANSK
jgi:glycosyltransferase involved in cell wall biosynthesis